jgi:monoterpene epsilon-lactone hydrolase
VPVLDVRPRGWTRDRRIIVYSVDYTLAPQAHWNTIQQQVLSVFAALRKRGYSMRDIAMAGDSAGGGLTVSTVLNLRDRGLGMPAAVVLMSP